MSASKPATAVEDDLVLAALENAPVDESALTPDQAAELEARMAMGSGRGHSTQAVLADIAERAKREG